MIRSVAIVGFVVVGIFLNLPRGVLGHGGHGFTAGEPGDPNKPFRVVTIEMREEGKKMSFAPSRVEAKVGEKIKFVIWNVGTYDHEFLLDSFAHNAKHKIVMQKYPDMEHDDPNGKTVKVAESAEIFWKFTKKGTFEFACLRPGHYEAGMKGVMVVR